jgi:hypothetical protein
MRNTNDYTIVGLINQLSHALNNAESKVENYTRHIYRMRTFVDELTVELKQAYESESIRDRVADALGHAADNLPELPYDLRKEF